MSQINELIEKLCPNGVEWKKLGEVGTFFNGVIGKSKADFENGNAKFISYMNVFSNPKLKIDVDDTIQINEGEKQHTLQYGDVIFTTSSETPNESGMSAVLTTKTEEKLYLNSFCFGFRFNNLDNINPDFYSYIFRSEPLRKQIVKCANGVTRFNISKENFVKVSIPVPPLEIQNRIVEILDHFTNLTANLTAELNLRRKQFEHYREKLLSLDGVEGVEWKTIGEECEIHGRIGWQGLTKKDYRSSGNYLLVTGTDFLSSCKINYNSCVYIDEDRYTQDKYIQLKENDLLITKDGTIGKLAIVQDLPMPATLNGGVFVIRNKTGNLYHKFLMYIMASSNFKNQIEQKHTNGTIKHLTQNLLICYKIPVPPLDVQQSIVEKLDKFTALIENIEKELDLRQKQYEFYREQLLSFN